MAGLEQVSEHLAPQGDRREPLPDLDVAALCHGFVERCMPPERPARAARAVPEPHRARTASSRASSATRSMNRSGIQLAVFMSWVRRRSSPDSCGAPGTPRCRYARFPGRRRGPLALPALINGDSRVVNDLQKRHHALRQAVGPLDIGPEAAHPRPVIAQATGKLGQQGVIPDSAVDAGEVVWHRSR